MPVHPRFSKRNTRKNGAGGVVDYENLFLYSGEFVFVEVEFEFGYGYQAFDLTIALHLEKGTYYKESRSRMRETCPYGFARGAPRNLDEMERSFDSEIATR